MSLRLETCVGTPLVRAALAATLALVLTAVVLALSPEAAEAQTSAPTEDRSAPAVVVRPGDSLWSISEERLGPNASPRRVMKGAERIHELNRARIGADPNLVLVGQELSIPRAMSGPPNGATLPARKAAEASGSDPRDRAAKVPAGKEAPRKAAGRGAIPRSEISVEEAAEMLGAETAGKEALPEPRAVAPVPVVGAVATKDAPFGVSADALGEGRWLLGLGVWALTFLFAAFMAWKLPMRRTTRGGDAERDEQDARREPPEAPGRGRRAVLTGSEDHYSAGRASKTGTPAGRGRTPRAKARAVPRNGLALGAHNPEVRRASRRVRATMQARRLHPRLRHGREVSARGGR